MNVTFFLWSEFGIKHAIELYTLDMKKSLSKSCQWVEVGSVFLTMCSISSTQKKTARKYQQVPKTNTCATIKKLLSKRMLKYPCAKPKKNYCHCHPSPHPPPQKNLLLLQGGPWKNPLRNGVPGTPKKRGDVKLTPVTHLQYKPIEEGYKCPHFLA